LQSETHEILCRNLSDITDRVNCALEENDVLAIIGLAEEHKEVMDSLRQADLSQDAGMLDLLKETHDKILGTVAEINKQRDELGRQLVMFERKQKVTAAYSGNRFSVMAVI
jgi:hypothetical protein